MPYVTQSFQLCIDEGIQKGTLQTARESVVEVLNLRFGETHPEIVERINAIDDTTVLKALLGQAVLAESLEKFQRFMDGLLRQTARSD